MDQTSKGTTAVTKKKPLALPAPPTRAALPSSTGDPREHTGYDDVGRFAASVLGMSVDEFYAELLGPRYRQNSPTGVAPPATRPTPKRPNLAGLYATELKGIEANMEKSPHGKSTHLIGEPTTPTGFLDGPPRPDRAEWERLTGLWLDAVEESLEESGQPLEDSS